MKDFELEFVKEIIAHSDGAEKRVGDFLIKNDYGSSAYYVGNGGDVVVPEGLDYDKVQLHFENAKGIVSLRFPGTLTSLSKNVVGAESFGSCRTLERLEFEEGIKRIWGAGCFANCPKLKVVVLPESLEELGLSAFKGSPWLRENLENEDGCHYLGKFLISADDDIVDAVIRDGTVQICPWAFRSKSRLRSVKIPESVKIISEQAFTSCCALERVIVSGNGLKSIGNSAFTGCVNLKHFEIPDSCESISEMAFISNMGKQLYLPDYAYIPNFARWSGNQNLFDCACYLTSKERHSSESKNLYDAACKRIKSKLLSFILEQRNFTALRNFAPIAITRNNIDSLIERSQCRKDVELTALLLEWREENVGTEALEKQQDRELKKDPFSATELKKIWSTKKLADGTIGITSYKGAELDLEIPAFIGKLKVTEICKEAFAASDYLSPGKRITKEQVEHRKTIRTVRIPEGVLSIATFAFIYCYGLTKVFIPGSVLYINEFAFDCCHNLTIHAPTGSYAERYAKENNIPFVAE